MLSVDLRSLWGDQTKEMCMGIDEATLHINQYMNERLLKRNDKAAFKELLKDITIVLEMWTGTTYVGCPKEECLEKSYQYFFETLLSFLLILKDNNPLISRQEKKLMKHCLYNGILYRYIGSDSPDNKENIKPRYNEIYVSWSKNPQSDYLESKFYGPITWMKCGVQKPFYGIDLSFFGVSRGEENEVVFPTIKECIIEIIEIE